MCVWLISLTSEKVGRSDKRLLKREISAVIILQESVSSYATKITEYFLRKSMILKCQYIISIKPTE